MGDLRAGIAARTTLHAVYVVLWTTAYVIVTIIEYIIIKPFTCGSGYEPPYDPDPGISLLERTSAR